MDNTREPTLLLPESRPPLNMDAWMWWQSPCTQYDMVPDEDFVSDFPVMGYLGDTQLLKMLTLTAHNALAQLDEFKNQFICETYNAKPTEKTSWLKVTSKWRPKFHENKELQVPFYRSDFIKDRHFDDFLADSLRYLQVIAVALEQMEYDHEDYPLMIIGKDQFLMMFRRVRQRMRIVMCILYNAMKERSIWMYPPYLRTHIDKAIRNVADPVERKLRDWIFLRDFGLVLQYVQEESDYYYTHLDLTHRDKWRQGFAGEAPVHDDDRQAPPFRKPPIEMDGPMWWDNPCDAHEHDDTVFEPGYKEPEPVDYMNDQKLLANIALIAHNAVKSVEAFKYQFVEQAFGVDYEVFHNEWKNITYWWMPRLNIDREKDKPLSEAELEKIKYDDFMCDALRFLQIAAVALEQVEYDHRPPFYDMSEYNNELYEVMFRNLRLRARLVMCELWHTIKERNMWPHETPTRHIMPDELRNMPDDTHRKMRDWIILRDTIMVLEFVMEVTAYFRDHIELVDRSKWSDPKVHSPTDPKRPVEIPCSCFSCYLTMANTREPTLLLPEKRPPLNMDAWMWWETPCVYYDMVPDEDFISDFPVMTYLGDTQLLNMLKLTSHSALAQLDEFKSQFLCESFNVKPVEYNSWLKVTPKWRPKFHEYKELHVPFESSDFMNQFHFDDFLADSLRYLQIVAVALEQFEYDHEDADLGVIGKDQFMMMLRRLRQRMRIVMCVLYNAMKERDIWLYPPYQRSFIDEKIRKVDDPVERKLRDWIFLRDLGLVMYYIMEFADFYTNNMRYVDKKKWRQKLFFGASPVHKRPPLPYRKEPIIMDAPMWWENPCWAQVFDQGVYDPGYEEPDKVDPGFHISDKQLLDNISLVAHNAVKSVEAFKYQFVAETFKVDYETFHNEWKNITYWWMPRMNIDREKDKPLTEAELEKLKFDDFMADALRFLQIAAVALEQVEHDHRPPYYDLSEYNNELYEVMFRRLRHRMRLVMCELWHTIREKEIWAHDTPRRYVMPDRLRNMPDDTHRKMRDWIILRDTIMVLEFIMEVSAYFRDHIELVDRSKWADPTYHQIRDLGRPYIPSQYIVDTIPDSH